MVHKDMSSEIGNQLIRELEKQELVTRTFRRLDPERQQVVLDALFDEAAAKGPGRLNIKQVAERSGASIGSLYQYFGNRKNLLAFAVKIVVFSLSEFLKLWRPYLQSMNLQDGLRAYLVESLKYCQTQESITKFLALAAYQGDEELGDSVVRPIANSIRETTRAMLFAAAKRGEIRADVDLEAAARVLNILMIVLGDSQLLPYLNRYFQATDDSIPFDRVLNAALDMVDRGLAPAPIGSPPGARKVSS